MRFTAVFTIFFAFLLLFTSCGNENSAENDIDSVENEVSDDSAETVEVTLENLMSNQDAYDSKTVKVCDTLKLDCIAHTLKGCSEGSSDCCNDGIWFIGFKTDSGAMLFLSENPLSGDECIPDEAHSFKYSDISRTLCVTGIFYKDYVDKEFTAENEVSYIVPGQSEFTDEEPVLDDGIEIKNELVSVESFYLQKYEVTVRDYQLCIDAGICENNNETIMYKTYEDLFGCNINSEKDVDNPVNCISLKGAKTYCEWKGMRLPTEVERGQAAKGTDERQYPWGDAYPSCTRIVMNSSAAGCGTFSTMVVGSKPDGATPEGIMDLSGNVAEWVSEGLVLGGSFGDRTDGAYDRFCSSCNYEDMTGGPNEYNGFRCASDNTID